MVKLAGTEDIALYLIFLRTLHAWVPNKLHACQEMEGAQFHLNSSRQRILPRSQILRHYKYYTDKNKSHNGKLLAVQGLTIIIVVIIILVVIIVGCGGGCLWFSWCCFCRGLFWRYSLLFRLLLCGFYNSIQDSDWVDQKLSESLDLAAEGYQEYQTIKGWE